MAQKNKEIKTPTHKKILKAIKETLLEKKKYSQKKTPIDTEQDYHLFI